MARYPWNWSTFHCRRARTDVTAAYKDYGPFKAWLRVHAQDSILNGYEIAGGIKDSLFAAQLEDDKCGAIKEWVGLLGFSQGANLAASILANQQVFRNRREIV
ncbi:hypothetical protein N7537_002754 [Penicillium hordei]|uniref:Serine hydrolase domain-containing protein n=1 Tax=Penicillium hordei TaxID=40994 RepID=A0AAD6H8X5_9EURO|nr:uncharacterized protein N7537_002754 [Penicillium hordei]KAJ5617640.1 hypothetical protein N7537_002754 [Penicillium hordei]